MLRNAILCRVVHVTDGEEKVGHILEFLLLPEGVLMTAHIPSAYAGSVRQPERPFLVAQTQAKELSSFFQSGE